ncbi:hypothetical protein ACQ4PT_023237 [Festuca glaucescens]
MEKYLNENPTNICTAAESSSASAPGYKSVVPQSNDLNNPVLDLSEAELKDGWVASSAQSNSSPCQQDDSHCGKKIRYPGPDLPDDIWRHIHFLLPMQDAARAACVSHSFQSSWRCYPNLIFTNQTMCSKERLLMQTAGSKVIADYNNNIDRVLMNHSGTGVTKFKLEYHLPYVAKPYNQLRSWLKFAITPGIEELDLTLLPKRATSFNFPCKLLSDRCRESIRYLRLYNCALLHKFELGLRNLKVLHLWEVRIKEDELGCLLSSSVALEHLKLVYCNDIMRLEIPCLLQRLSFLEVFECGGLQVLETKAPNISTFDIVGNQVQLSLGESLKLKNLKLYLSCAISYAIDKLPSCVPNLETLTIYSSDEMVNAPMVSSKFLHLNYLTIQIFGWHFHRDYDYLSLVSFFDASPFLEKFVLYVKRQSMYDSFEGDPSSLRQMPKHRHGNLKRVRITGFCPQKSMIELACHILQNATSLKLLTLDASPVNGRCSGNVMDRKCPPLETPYIRQAHKTILAVRTYIQAKVPRRVKLNVLEPCSRCHAL